MRLAKGTREVCCVLFHVQSGRSMQESQRLQRSRAGGGNQKNDRIAWAGLEARCLVRNYRSLRKTGAQKREAASELAAVDSMNAGRAFDRGSSRESIGRHPDEFHLIRCPQSTRSRIIQFADSHIADEVRFDAQTDSRQRMLGRAAMRIKKRA
jgi:hypothetical protein